MSIEVTVTHTAPSLETALECFSVMDPTEKNEHTPHWPQGWWALCDDEGIIAYFATEADAFRYRLCLVNMACNPL